MFFNIGVLKNFTIFTGKYVLGSLFDKAAGLQVCNFLKKRLQHKCFPVNIAILPPQASHPQQFSALVAKYTLHDGTELDDDCFADNKEMNPILTLLIMKVKVVTVTMTCTPDHPKHRALNSLYDMAYYK